MPTLLKNILGLFLFMFSILFILIGLDQILLNHQTFVVFYPGIFLGASVSALVMNRLHQKIGWLKTLCVYLLLIVIYTGIGHLFARQEELRFSLPVFGLISLLLLATWLVPLINQRRTIQKN